MYISFGEEQKETELCRIIIRQKEISGTQAFNLNLSRKPQIVQKAKMSRLAINLNGMKTWELKQTFLILSFQISGIYIKRQL